MFFLSGNLIWIVRIILSLVQRLFNALNHFKFICQQLVSFFQLVFSLLRHRPDLGISNLLSFLFKLSLNIERASKVILQFGINVSTLLKKRIYFLEVGYVFQIVIYEFVVPLFQTILQRFNSHAFRPVLGYPSHLFFYNRMRFIILREQHRIEKLIKVFSFQVVLFQLFDNLLNNLFIFLECCFYLIYFVHSFFFEFVLVHELLSKLRNFFLDFIHFINFIHG